MYFIYGEESFLISNEEKRIIKKFGIEPIIFDESSNINEILKELETVPMFNGVKVVIMRDISAFSKVGDAHKILEIIKNIDRTVKVIFVRTSSKPKAVNPLVKYLMSFATTNRFDRLKSSKVIETIKIIVNSKGGSITTKAAIELSAKVPNDLRIINNEIDKLLLENIHITNEMIETSISHYVMDDYFSFANAIVEKNPLELSQTYKERIFSGDEPLMMIGQIASTLLLANKIYNFKQTGMTIREISETTKIHIFRIRKANELLMKTSPKKLNFLINSLANLDYNIKTGKIDPKIGLDQFILNYIK